MNESPHRLFGLTIAYVLPGLACLWGLSDLLPDLRTMIWVQPQCDPALATMLYALLASLAAGLTVSALRWLLIDPLHHHTGVPFPNPDFGQVQANYEAFRLAIELYYQYYQFYANMLVSLAIAAACRLMAGQWLDLRLASVLVTLLIVLLAASRDSLRRYYTRIGQLLGTREIGVSRV